MFFGILSGSALFVYVSKSDARTIWIQVVAFSRFKNEYTVKFIFMQIVNIHVLLRTFLNLVP